jgi:hypothetical protein
MAWWGAFIIVVAILLGMAGTGFTMIRHSIVREDGFPFCAGVLLLLVTVGLSLMSWRMLFPPEGVRVISLRSDEWACTASVVTPVTTYVQTGKAMVPITTMSRRCTQWNREG